MDVFAFLFVKVRVFTVWIPVFFIFLFSFVRHFSGHILTKNVYFGGVMTGLLHSVGCLILAIASFADMDRWEKDDKLTALHYLTMIYSGTYFVNDLYVTLIVRFMPLFAVHHVLVIIGYAFFWYHGYGAYLFSCLLFLGEITNPIQNLCEMFRQMNRIMKSWNVSDLETQKKSDDLHLMFKYFFIFVRSVVIPHFLWSCYSKGTFEKLEQNSGSRLFKCVIEFVCGFITVASSIWCYQLLSKK